MNRFLIIINLFCLFVVSSLQAQQVNFKTILNKKEIGLDEKITVRFYLEARDNVPIHIEDFQLPSFSNLQVVYNSKPEIKRESKNHIKYNYTIVLKPLKKGTVKIGRASVVINDRVYVTKPVSFKVNNERHIAIDVDKPYVPTSKDIFVTFDISNKNPYQYESFTGVLKLYSKTTGINIKYQRSDFKGFTVKPLKTAQGYEQKRIGKDIYLVQDIASYLMYANKSGKLEIPSIYFTISFLSPYLYQEQEIELQTSQIALNVKPLPKDEPKSFKGAVGDFKVDVGLDKDSIKLKESSTLTTKIEGIGNFDLINPPNLYVPVELQQYKPKEQRNYTPNYMGTSGKIISTIVLVPQSRGYFKIEIEPFSYFNPIDHKYHTISIEPLMLTIGINSSPGNTQLEQVEVNNEMKNRMRFFKNGNDDYEEEVENKSAGNEYWYIILGLFSILSLSILGTIFLFKKKKKNKNKQDQADNFVNPVKTKKVINIESPKPKKDINFSLENELNQLNSLKETQNLDGFCDIIHKIYINEPNEKLGEIIQEIQEEKFSPIKTPDFLEEIYLKVNNLLKA